MEQTSRFQKLVLAAKEQIKEISPNDAASELSSGAATLIDVRSDEDWKSGHARGAKHLDRGEIEVEIEERDSGSRPADHLLLRRREPFRARRGEPAEDGLPQRPLDDGRLSRMEGSGVARPCRRLPLGGAGLRIGLRRRS